METVTIALLGDTGVGKSCMTCRYVFEKYAGDTIDPTIVDTYKKKITIDGMNIGLEILDTAGQEEYAEHLLDSWIDQADGYIVVYDVTRSKTVFKAQAVLKRIHMLKDERLEKAEEFVPIIVCGNKDDVDGEEKKVSLDFTQRVLTGEDSKYNSIYETSAKNNTNITESIEEALRLVLRTRAIREGKTPAPAPTAAPVPSASDAEKKPRRRSLLGFLRKRQ